MRLPAASTEDDWDLLSAAGGDQTALSELFRRHRNFVFRMVLARLQDHHMAEDVTQEVFLALARRKPPLWRRARFRTWLYRVASNHAIDQIRKQRRSPISFPADPPMAKTDASRDGDQFYDNRRELEQVFKALAELPERQRQVATLRLLEGLSTEETASMLSISSGSVKTHLHRASQALDRRFNLCKGEPS